MRSAIRSSNRQVLTDDAHQRLARHGFCGGEDRCFDPEHPFAPAGGRRQVGEFDVQAVVAVSPAAARRGAHRPYSRNAGRPVNSRDGAERDQPVEQPAGGAVGHRRRGGGFGGGDAILGEQQVDDFGRRLRSQFGRDGDQGFGAAAQDRRRGRGRRRRPARSRPRRRLARLGRPALAVVRRPGIAGLDARIAVAISGTGRGQRSRMAMTMSNAQSARISASAAVASGTAEKAAAAAFAAAETGSPSPEQCFRVDARPFGSGRARSSRAAASRIRPGSRLGGRPARSRHSDKRFAAGPSAFSVAKRRSRSAPSSALRRRILAVAAALFSARRAWSAPAAGGSARRNASRSASPAPAANSGSPSPALPLARAQAGIGAGGGKACLSGAFVEVRLVRRGCRSDAGAPFQRGWSAVGEQLEIGANHVGMVNRRRRFVTSYGE